MLALSLPSARAATLTLAAQGLVDAERAFALLAREANTREAFLGYLTDESITFRQGPQKGKARYLKETAGDSLLEWAPAFVDVAASGDLGYDLGPWAYWNHRTDPKPVAWGTFVTLWKKQPDGVWRVALDLGIPHRPSPEAVPAVPATSSHRSASVVGTRSGDFRADLLTAEREFISRFAQSGTDVYASTLSTEARLYRPGLPPAVSPGEIRNYFETQRGVEHAVYELIEGETASTGDLGYVYGWVTTEASAAGMTEAKRANYLRIWKREDGRAWKVVLDLIGAN